MLFPIMLIAQCFEFIRAFSIVLFPEIQTHDSFKLFNKAGNIERIHKFLSLYFPDCHAHKRFKNLRDFTPAPPLHEDEKLPCKPPIKKRHKEKDGKYTRVWDEYHDDPNWHPPLCVKHQLTKPEVKQAINFPFRGRRYWECNIDSCWLGWFS